MHQPKWRKCRTCTRDAKNCYLRGVAETVPCTLCGEHQMQLCWVKYDKEREAKESK